ncbi:MAG TPA: hypothetical protein VF851_10335 [Steroidobacteraceae bacterium]
MRAYRLTFIALTTLSAGLFALPASAGAVAEQFRGGAFGLPWNAGKSAIQAKYPGGTWDKDESGVDRYCAPSRQALLGLPAQHQTRELCFLIGHDGTMASASAHMDPTLPALLAVVNRSRTRFGDFDSMKRDREAIQSRFSYMMWTKDSPIIVIVGSQNDNEGRPNQVAFTVADEATLYTSGAEKVSNRPAGSN